MTMTHRLTTWIVTFIVFLAFGATAACSKDEAKDQDKGAKTPTTQPQPDKAKPPAPTPTEGTELADDDVPVETDFEDEAEKSITADNFMQELEALEKEIEAGE